MALLLFAIIPHLQSILTASILGVDAVHIDYSGRENFDVPVGCSSYPKLSSLHRNRSAKDLDFPPSSSASWTNHRRDVSAFILHPQSSTSCLDSIKSKNIPPILQRASPMDYLPGCIYRYQPFPTLTKSFTKWHMVNDDDIFQQEDKKRRRKTAKSENNRQKRTPTKKSSNKKRKILKTNGKLSTVRVKKTATAKGDSVIQKRKSSSSFLNQNIMNKLSNYKTIPQTKPQKSPSASSPKNSKRATKTKQSTSDLTSKTTDRFPTSAEIEEKSKELQNATTTTAKKAKQTEEAADEEEELYTTMYIQFSRVFQRHVVYRRYHRYHDSKYSSNNAVVKYDTNGSSDGISDSVPNASNDSSIPSHRDFYSSKNSVSIHNQPYVKEEILQSFEFLEDATSSYPQARVMSPKDLPLIPPSCSLDASSFRNIYGNGVNGAAHLDASDDIMKEEQEGCEVILAGMGLRGMCDLEYPQMDNYADVDPKSTDQNAQNKEESRYEKASAALRLLLRLVSSPNSDSSFVLPRHFFRLDPRRMALRGLTPERIQMNYDKVVELLSCGRDVGRYTSGGNSVGISDDTADNDRSSNMKRIGLAMDSFDVQFVISNFPQLCLYDGKELETLIRFLISPIPPNPPGDLDRRNTRKKWEGIDWPKLASEGYGAGLSLHQATQAIRMMPELLSLYYEDSRKPSLLYLCNQMNSMNSEYNKQGNNYKPDGQGNQQVIVTPKTCDETNFHMGDYLIGTDASDAYTLAYLRALGVDWDPLKILMEALPLWSTCNLDPGWELLQRGPIRNVLKRSSLDFLRQRFQVRPSDIFHMLKTHTRLGGYDACKNVRTTLDALQMRLGFSSAELRRVMLRMPSLMGMSSKSLEEKIEFYLKEAEMSLDQLRKSVLKQPTLLHYSVNSSLRPKRSFFIDELGIPASIIGKIIYTAPAIMGLSLPNSLRPKVTSIMIGCSLDQYQVGTIISSSPRILLLSKKGKIEPTLKYLSSVLMLNETGQLGEVLLRTPRVLQHGLETSIGYKVNRTSQLVKEMTKYQHNHTKVAAKILQDNPSLLAQANSVFEDRIRRSVEGDGDIFEALRRSTRGRKKLKQQSTKTLKKKRDPIFLSSDGASLESISRIYPSAKVAARDIGISESSVLEFCDNNTSINGNYFNAIQSIHEQSHALHDMNTTGKGSNTQQCSCSIFCSGGIFPNDSSYVARGQSLIQGGIALQVFSEDLGNSTFHTRLLRKWINAAESSFGIRVPLGANGDGSMLLAVFPFLNPSRNRCELYSCYGALRMIEALVENGIAEANLPYNFQICTDSSHAWKLVRDKEKLLRLGSYTTSKEMISQLGDLPKESVNIDILHPLARTFYRLNSIQENGKRRNKSVNVDFVHSMDSSLTRSGYSVMKNLKQSAKYAAEWQFNRERNFVKQ